MRWFLLIFLLFAFLFAALMGQRGDISRDRPLMVFPDMDNQYKLKAQKSSEFFADGQVAREPVPGTVPMGFNIPDKAISQGGKVTAEFAISDEYYSTGRMGDYFGDGFPEGITVDQRFLDRGQERYAVFCTPCHGDSGNGKGPVGQFWMGGMLPPTANLVDARVSALPDGQIYWTITHGKGLMGPYGGNITIPDRWAIVAYVRALQLSQNANVSDEKVKEAFEAAPKANQEGNEQQQ